MKRLTRVLALAAVAAPALSLAAETTWNLDPAHTTSSFAVRHLVVSTVRGEFGKTTGVARIDDKDPARSSVEAIIDATTIDTRVADRDTHLKSPDFFDVASYPTIVFKSTKVVRTGNGRYRVTGDLTMKGTAKPVVLEVQAPSSEVKDPMGNVRRGFSATAKVNRKDFGLNWSKMVEAGPVVGDAVSIQIDGELVKQGAEQAKK